MKVFKVLCLILLMISVIIILFLFKDFRVADHIWIDDFYIIARDLNINNLVTAVYLGPRVIDTFIEVLVVVLTVFGIKLIREK